MTTTERDQTCESRIAAHMDSRAEDFEILFKIANGEKDECPTCEGTGYVIDADKPRDAYGNAEPALDEDGDEIDCPKCDGTGEVLPEYDGEELDDEQASDRLSELPLAVSLKRSVRIDLSTGGPGDWLEADIDEDGRVEDVSYHFNDWYDHAERRVSEDSPLWRAAEYYAEYVSFQ